MDHLGEASPNPRDFNLPHDTWRPHQYETAQWIMSRPPGTVSLVEAATGSGKSAYACAAGSRSTTIVLVETKQLQTQYEKIYGAAKVMGKGNYPCCNQEQLIKTTADDCLYSTMGDCPVAEGCKYLTARDEAMTARFKVLNYSYFSLVGNIKTQDGPLWDKQYLFLDEAHQLSEMCLGRYSIKVTPLVRQRWEFDRFPQISPTYPDKMLANRSVPWIEQDIEVVKRRIKGLKRDEGLEEGVGERQKITEQRKRAERMKERLGTVRRAILSTSEDWFIKSDDEEGFVARPLTAKHVFPKLFLRDWACKVVCMSATIGDFGDHTEELGIGKYEGRVVESRFAPEQRPIYVFKNAPRMSYGATKKNPSSFNEQADIISQIIHECPEEWSGLIHVTRKREAELLRRRLSIRGLGSRVVASPGHDGSYVPTNKQLEFWEGRKRRVGNSIMICWSFGTGFDGLDERINISAKVPFSPYGAPGSYEEAWREYSQSRYMAATANALSQQMGRTRRGREEDYDIDEVTGYNAVVDGSLNGQVRGKMAGTIRDSLVEV